MGDEPSEQLKFLEAKARFDRNFEQLNMELRARADQAEHFVTASRTLESASQALRKLVREIWDEDESQGPSKRRRLDDDQTTAVTTSSVTISAERTPSRRETQDPSSVMAPLPTSTVQSVAQRSASATDTVTSQELPLANGAVKPKPSVQTDVPSTSQATSLVEVKTESTIPIVNSQSEVEQRAATGRKDASRSDDNDNDDGHLNSTINDGCQLPEDWFDPANAEHQANLEAFKKKLAKLKPNCTLSSLERSADSTSREMVKRLAEIYRNSLTLAEFSTTLMLNFFDRAELDDCYLLTLKHESKRFVQCARKATGGWEPIKFLDLNRSKYIFEITKATRSTFIRWDLCVESMINMITNMGLENAQNKNWARTKQSIKESALSNRR